MSTVRIPFEVTGWDPDPQTPAEHEAVRLGRVTLRKTFHGPLTGTSVVAMTSAAVGDAPAGYAAVELVTGTLEGRRGAFVLQHTGVVEAGTDPAGVVVPGTGTGELAGLTGTMTISHDDGATTLVLDYQLP